MLTSLAKKIVSRPFTNIALRTASLFGVICASTLSLETTTLGASFLSNLTSSLGAGYNIFGWSVLLTIEAITSIFIGTSSWSFANLLLKGKIFTAFLKNNKHPVVKWLKKDHSATRNGLAIALLQTTPLFIWVCANAFLQNPRLLLSVYNSLHWYGAVLLGGVAMTANASICVSIATLGNMISQYTHTARRVGKIGSISYLSSLTSAFLVGFVFVLATPQTPGLTYIILSSLSTLAAFPTGGALFSGLAACFYTCNYGLKQHGPVPKDFNPPSYYRILRNLPYKSTVQFILQTLLALAAGLESGGAIAGANFLEQKDQSVENYHRHIHFGELLGSVSSIITLCIILMFLGFKTQITPTTNTPTSINEEFPTSATEQDQILNYDDLSEDKHGYGSTP